MTDVVVQNGAQVPPATVITENLERPELDNRQYRVLKLQNELEVLLVHDPDTDKASAAMDVYVGNYADSPDLPVCHPRLMSNQGSIVSIADILV